MGTSVSLISTGVFLRKLELAPEPSAPSPPDQPPAPPVIGSIEAMIVRPLRLSVVLTFMMAPPPAGPAGKRSGTAAGNFGLRMVPSGTMQRAGRVMPPFRRIVGSML